MKYEIKLTLYAGGIAFFLSLVLGIFAGNPAGVVFIRAIVSSLLLGGLFYLSIYIIVRYIPEIITPEGSKGKKDETEMHTGGGEEEGKYVNYLVQDEEGGGNRNQEGTDLFWEQSARAKDTAIGETKHAFTSEQEETSGIEKPEEKLQNYNLPSIDSMFEGEEGEYYPEVEPQIDVEKSSNRPKGSYIQVGSARFPNEPEAIARAIQKVMRQNGSK